MLTEDLKAKITSFAFDYPDITQLQFIRDAKDDIDITDICGDGLVNNVVVVRPAGQLSPAVVFKHAPSYAKFLGPDTPVSQDRTATEFNSYVYFNKLCPGSTPIPYGYSAQNSILAMEYLDEYESLLENMMKASVNWRILEELTVTIAKLHSSTHRICISLTEFAELQREFPMTEVAAKVGDYIFGVLSPVKPAYPSNAYLRETADDMYSDRDFLANVRAMKDLYFNRKECLAHYDLHAGSVMVKGSSMKIIDNEFTVVGAAALDMATFSNHFIYNYVREMTTINSENRDQDSTVADEMLKGLQYIIDLYTKQMSTALNKEEEATKCAFDSEAIISEIAGLMGCFICERMLGGFPTKDADTSDAGKLRCLQIGVRLVRQYPAIRTVEALIECVRLGS